MADSKIFFLEDNASSLAALVEAPYDTEDILQALRARYHDLLPGDQIDPESPRRWLFVSREMGVPGEAGGGDQWSLDHLFLDQDAIPTFVECKRSSDTRGRRPRAVTTEVVPHHQPRRAAALAAARALDVDEGEDDLPRPRAERDDAVLPAVAVLVPHRPVQPRWPGAVDLRQRQAERLTGMRPRVAQKLHQPSRVRRQKRQRLLDAGSGVRPRSIQATISRS